MTAHNNSYRKKGALCICAALVAPEIYAQTEIEEIQVIGHPLDVTAAELAQPVSIIGGETLDRVRAANLGETLAGELGVNATYFGAGASRPVIRGLAGARVRTMQDGIDSMDVSTVSVDHAVGIDPLVAQQIEIFRGPTTLLYGSGAVGGVVNTVTNRIPEFAPEDGFEGAFELRGDSAAGDRAGAIALDGGSDSFAWHVDALSRSTDNYEIPGFAVLEEDEREEDAVPGIVENSDIDVESLSIGGSWLFDDGFFGVSVSSFDTNYGVPGHHHHEEDAGMPGMPPEEEEEEIVRIDLGQTRVDLQGGWYGLASGIEAINFRMGINDYEHIELEGDEIGTRFNNDAYEGRVEVVHSPWGAWDGAVGVQFSQREFSSIGDEAFVPPVDTLNYGFFIIEERQTENWQISLGGRVEWQEHSPSTGREISDTATSVSAAAIRPFGNGGYSFVVNSALAERLPVAEELFSDGPHLATQIIEVGRSDLSVETSQHLDFGIRKTEGNLQWAVTAFVTSYDDFIYLQDTGVEDPDEELPVFNFAQRDADFVGLEAELFTTFARVGQGEMDLRLFVDFVEGELNSGEYLPRIPPRRYGARLQYHDDRIIVGLEATEYDDQNDVAPFEEATAGYTMVNADINWRIETARGPELTLFVRGTNLSDEDARRHTSFAKETAPLIGRNVSVGFRASF
ncbi:MAG: TonB-dependent receptor [Gammaproteobacteria bacterium]|nr:TonB-dependent receptor [Gammaproteobacteria bacterium]